MASRHEEGVSLRDLVEVTGLERATVYRLASTLVASDFAQRDDRKNYRLGIASMQLGLTAMSRAPLLEACRPAMQALARITEDTVYLVVRNGDYGHCLHREEGSFPIKTFTSIVGSLRPLGLGTAGQALLATLPLPDVEQLYRRHSADFDRAGLSRLALQDLVRRIHRTGYSTSDDLVTAGVAGVGRAFRVTPSSFAAISVGAIKPRMDAKRRQWIAELIGGHMRELGFEPVHGPVEQPPT